MSRPDNEPGIEDQLRMAEEQLHIYDAIAAAAADPQEVLRVIFQADDPDHARRALCERYSFDEMQANAVLDMQFRRTTRRDRARIHTGREEIATAIDDLRSQGSDTTR